MGTVEGKFQAKGQDSVRSEEGKDVGDEDDGYAKKMAINVGQYRSGKSSSSKSPVAAALSPFFFFFFLPP